MVWKYNLIFACTLLFISFVCYLSVKHILMMSRESEDSCLVPDFRRNTLMFPFSTVLTMNFSYVAITVLKIDL